MNYYIFETKFSNRIAAPRSEHLTYDDFNNLSCGKLEESDLVLEFVVDSKKILTPILSPVSVGFYLFSNMVTDRLHKERIQGAKFIKTMVKNEKGEPTPLDYSVLSVVKESDEVDYKKSVDLGDGYISGLYIPGIDCFDIDVFRPKNSLYIIVSDKFKKIIDEFKLNNVVFTNLKDVRLPKFIVKNKL